MTKFEDQLFGQLMAEHGHRLRALQRPAPARRRVRRPVWLATGAAGAVAAVTTAAVMALGSAPALAAYSVTQHGNGTVTVSVARPSGVAGANAALHAMRARVRVVPVRPGCPAIGSLPRPRPAPHPSGVGHDRGDQERASLCHGQAGQGRHPRRGHDDTGVQRQRRPGSTSLGAGGIMTGRVPRCVSLPPAPSGGGGSG